MSVTFFIPDVPTKLIHPFPEEPEYSEEVPVEPFFELNLCNTNAADLIELIAPGHDHYCGEWNQNQISYIQKNAMKLLNDPTKYISEAFTERNIHFCGRNMEYTVDRITKILELLKLAVMHNKSICYG